MLSFWCSRDINGSRIVSLLESLAVMLWRPNHLPNVVVNEQPIAICWSTKYSIYSAARGLIKQMWLKSMEIENLWFNLCRDRRTVKNWNEGRTYLSLVHFQSRNVNRHFFPFLLHARLGEAVWQWPWHNSIRTNATDAPWDRGGGRMMLWLTPTLPLSNE